MFLLGIDIAKLNHVASCIESSTNEVIFSNFILSGLTEPLVPSYKKSK